MPLLKSQKVQAEDPRVQAKTDKEPEMLTETATKRERERKREAIKNVKFLSAPENFCAIFSCFPDKSSLCELEVKLSIACF